jgi:iron complex outermembrane receptor protein
MPLRSDLRSNLELSYLEVRTRLIGRCVRVSGHAESCNITSCSGAPEWRAWQNGGVRQPARQHGGVSHRLLHSGYDTASLDFGGVPGDCQGNADIASSTAAFVDGTPAFCRTDAQWNVDMTIRHRINEQYLVYLDVLNVLDIEPEFDPAAAYALFGFNPAWAGPNIMGRYYRLGVKVDF